MSLVMQLEAGGLLLVAALLSGIIGFNRERVDHPAGMRTHILVGVGTCVFTLLSIHAFPGGDPARIAAQIVTGIGFLGAGAIFKRGNDMRGLTTAATIWVTAALGMAVGTGAWLLGILVTLLTLCTLVLIQKFKSLF